MEVFIDQPKPVFDILCLLKEDTVHFVKKSVANHITDYLKVNPPEAQRLITEWQTIENEHTQWILRYAQRKLKKNMRSLCKTRLVILNHMLNLFQDLL